MKKFLILGVTAAALCAAPALAADMPVKAPYVAPMFNWSGFYLGIEGGDGSARTQHFTPSNGTGSGVVGIHGGLAGGTYGYNWQAPGSHFVFGFEGDFSWSGIKRKFNDTGNGFCTSPFLCVTDLQWLGTDRVRLGFAADRLLIYGTAGIAYGDVLGTLTNAGFTIDSNVRAAFIYGGGVEWAFAPLWSIKAEYLRTDFGNRLTYGVPAVPLTETVSLKHLDMVRIGLNYKFSGW